MFFLTLKSILHQNLTCQPSSSYCRIPMILDTLKNELKSPFTANTTKDFLLHADKNGEHSVNRTCILVMRMGCTYVWRIPVEIISTHTTSTSLAVLIRAHKRHKICRTEICLSSVGPEHQPSKRYTLMYLGVPNRSKSYMFGDNKSVVDSNRILSKVQKSFCSCTHVNSC